MLLMDFYHKCSVFCSDVTLCLERLSSVSCTCSHSDGLGALLNLQASNICPELFQREAIKPYPCDRLCSVFIFVQFFYCYRNDFVCWALEEMIAASGPMICSPLGLDFPPRGISLSPWNQHHRRVLGSRALRYAFVANKDRFLSCSCELLHFRLEHVVW